MQKVRRRIVVPRDVLLVEIERRCPACNTKMRLGLTKEEARAYQGFTCERCERRTQDSLTERDVPDWWEELMITGLATLRASHAIDQYEPSETVKRMSAAYREKKEATEEDSF